MEIGKPQRIIIVEPLELPVGNPERAPCPACEWAERNVPDLK
jgi:hypothetical protein